MSNFTPTETALLLALTRHYAMQLRASMKRADLTADGLRQYQADLIVAETVTAKLCTLQVLQPEAALCDE